MQLMRGTRRWNRPAQFRHCFSETIVAVVGFSFGVSAFGSECHGLAVFRNDGFTLTMVLAASLFDFTCERVRIYLFDGDGGAPVTGYSLPSYLAV